MKWIFALVSLACLAAALAAQERLTLVSPEVRQDCSVIFRLWAPQASDVKLSANWMGPQPPIPLTKRADGVWTGYGGAAGAEHLFVRFFGRRGADNRPVLPVQSHRNS